jgi:prepilin-type N-terminal cleavage/methylation domain-containing protein
MKKHSTPGGGDDAGFTLIELLIVIVLLGVLSTVVVFAVGGITDRGTTAACRADGRALETAASAYFAETGRTTIEGATPEARVQTLVTGSYLSRVSSKFHLSTAGQLVELATSPCAITMVS